MLIQIKQLLAQTCAAFLSDELGMLSLLLCNMVNHLLFWLFRVCLFRWLRAQRCELLKNALTLSLGVAKPVHRPDTATTPAKLLQHTLPQTITIPRRLSRMVGRTVAFDAHQVAAGLARISHGQVDEKPSDPNLRLTLITMTF